MSKLESLEELKDVQSMPELQARFAEFLELDKAVPLGAIYHALEDQYYRHNLILCRKRPDMLAQLLAHPKNADYELAANTRSEKTTQKRVTSAAHKAVDRSNLELAAKAGKAIFKWAKSGFARVDEETFQRRFGACESCDQLTAAPEKLVYKLTRSKRSDQRVCSACGCVAARKAGMASESCPLQHPDNAAVDRWGEAYEHPKQIGDRVSLPNIMKGRT